MYKQELQKTNSVQNSFNQKIEKEKLVRLDPTGLMLGSKSHRSKLELGQSLKVNEQQVHKIREHNKQPLLRLLVDSGSTINVITDERHFSTYTLTTNSTRQHVKDAGGHVHHTKGHGTVTGIVHGINGREEILIHAVHIPTFSINILSTNMMRKIGYSIILPTSRLGYTETPSHNKITHGTYSDGLEYLELNTESTCTSQVTAEPSHRVHASMHKRGGGAAKTVLPKMSESFKEFLTKTSDQTLEQEQELFRTSMKSQDLTPFEKYLQEAEAEELISRLANPDKNDDGTFKQNKIQRKLINMKVYAPLAKDKQNDLIMKYHCMLGHANIRAVQQHAKMTLTKEEYKKLSFNQKLWCDSCIKSKSKRKSVPKKAISPTAPTQPWQHQSCDVLGRWDQKSHGGSFHYAFLFVDSYSSDKRLYGMKTLTEVPAVIENHLNWCRAGYPRSQIKGNTKVHHIPTSEASLKSDATTLLRTAQVQHIFGKYGVEYKSAQPYTQQRNGKCERHWQTIKASAHAMRTAYNLPIAYWYLSIKHATYLSTILSTSPNPDQKSPYQMITGKKPPCTHLQIFGSPAYVNRPTVQMGQDKAVAGRYVGYYPPSQSHLVLIPPTTKGGCPSLEEFKSKTPGAVKPRARTQLLESIHVDIHKEVPPAVLLGEVPLVAPGYVAHDPEDEEETILIGGEEEEENNSEPQTPTEDRTTEDVLDLDWHNTHCITTPSQCTCMQNDPKRGSNFTQYINHTKDVQNCVEIKLPSPLPHHKQDEAAHDDISHLVPYPRVLALGGILPSWSAAKKTQNQVHREMFSEARDTEIKNLIERNVIEKIQLKDVPSGTKIMPSLMNFVLKTDAQNNVTRARARWVLGGHKQVQGIHYNESAAFCPRWSTVRTLIADCARKGKTLRSADISSAYLNSPGESTLYMHSPHDQRESSPDGTPYVWKVPGNLYGRKEAGAMWGKYFTKFLKSIGFKNSKADPCYFTRTKTINHKKYTTSLIVYVDDLAYFSNTDEANTYLERELTEKFGNIKAETPDQFLGANVHQSDDGIHLSHSAMIDRMAQKFFPHLDPSKVDVSKVKTPFPSHGSALGAEVKISDCPDIENGEPTLNAPYRELVGSLSYCAVTTRPDIAYYTSQLARVQSNPGEIHFKLAKHVLRYLMATRTHGIMYRVKGTKLVYYTDASWADVTPAYVTGTDGQQHIFPNDADDGRRSSYGYVGYYASGPISWAARIHKGRRSLSTAESELVAANEAAKDIVHLRQVLDSMGEPESTPTTIWEDNQAVIDITMRDGITARTKHIEVKWYYIRDLQKDGIVNISKKHTDENVADIYTKRLSVEKFEIFRDELVQEPELRTTFSEDAHM